MGHPCSHIIPSVKHSRTGDWFVTEIADSRDVGSNLTRHEQLRMFSYPFGVAQIPAIPILHGSGVFRSEREFGGPI